MSTHYGTAKTRVINHAQKQAEQEFYAGSDGPDFSGFGSNWGDITWSDVLKGTGLTDAYLTDVEESTLQVWWEEVYYDVWARLTEDDDVLKDYTDEGDEDDD